MSTGQQHPHGPSSGFFECDVRGLHRHWQFSIQVSEDNVGILFQAPINDFELNELYIWNWRVGTLTKCIKATSSTYLQSFAFLTSSCVLLSAIRGGTGELHLHDFTDPGDTVNCISPARCTFCYPSFSSYICCALTIRVDPSPSWVPDNLSKAPFHSTPDSRIVAIGVGLFNHTRNDMVSWIHIVPLSVFTSVSHLKQVTMEWGDWGRRNTCFLDTQFSQAWPCYVSGTRFISIARQGEDDDTGDDEHEVDWEVSVYDFNPLALRRAIRDGLLEDIVSDTVVSIDSPIGLTAYLTALRYKMKTISLPSRLARPDLEVMISEDSLILVDGHSESDPTFTILTF
ncbi:hypothetical protein JAAARDRAFT_320955 [Jaapia argillacea MUCL 33604]|uniref:Uncharacterized protein n=1 Tax=Jaapia argillacea MUCL 33604 TaxID=933084 RepID=A0A067PMU7_9AGAM|nr:hypothetical protein JAAARDRAFT_320955 [Jaapia argillacea MUCL 33604]